MKYLNRDLYNNTNGKGYGESRGLEPGWYPCVILNAVEGESNWGTPQMTFSFDVIDGEYKRYFEIDYKNSTSDPKKWRGTLDQAIDERGMPYFKGLITAIENSNPGYKFDFDESTLNGKKVGIGFRKEWYEKDGQDKYVVRAFTFCDIAKVISGELPVPKDKPKKNATNNSGYSVPVPPALASAPNPAPSFGTLSSDDDDLPF